MLGDDGLNIQPPWPEHWFIQKLGQRFACGIRHLGETAQTRVFLDRAKLPSW